MSRRLLMVMKQDVHQERKVGVCRWLVYSVKGDFGAGRWGGGSPSRTSEGLVLLHWVMLAGS
jgi:hypothetical protein